MEVKLIPLTFPKSLPQGIKIYTEWATFESYPKAISGSHTSTFTCHRAISQVDQRPPICLRFTEYPVKVLPGSGGTRQLPVAFDSIWLCPEYQRFRVPPALTRL